MAKRRTTINSRRKGKTGERAVAKMMGAWWGCEMVSTPLSGGFGTQSFRTDMNIAGDLTTPDRSFPFCVEVKNCEGWHLEQFLTAPKCDLFSWWAQTIRETPDMKIPILCFTRNRQPWFFAMYEDDFDSCAYLGENLWSLTLRDPNNPGHAVKIGLLEEFVGSPKDHWLSYGETYLKKENPPCDEPGLLDGLDVP